MKKTYYIIGGAILLVCIAGFWVYSFLYGSPQNTPAIFTNLGIFGQTSTENIAPIIPTPAPEVSIPIKKLRQLTTRPVVGMRLLKNGDTSIMRYVEAGTGHIYDIDMATNNEVRISQISIPLASEAALSPHGDYVAIRSGYNQNNEVIILDITTKESPTQKTLSEKVESFAFTYSNELVFTEQVGATTEGKGYLPSTSTTRRLFTIPFTDVSMAWSDSSTTPHHVYTKPTKYLQGYAYEIRDTTIRRVAISGLGLAIVPLPNAVMYGSLTNNSYNWSYYIKSNNTTARIPLNTAPQKCVAAKKADIIAYCGANLDTVATAHYPDDWNKGTYSAEDRIVAVKESGGYTQFVNPIELVGRTIDVINMSIDTTGGVLYFLNKTDRTLWVYDLSS
jgi:hypothetical protein